MDRKLLFFDIDGTLVDEAEHRVPDSARDALRMARENGHMLFINTGRSVSNVENDLIELGFDGVLCSCGTHIRIGGETLLCEQRTHEESREIALAVRECRLGVFFEGNRYMFFDPAAGFMNESLIARRDRCIRSGIERDVDPEDPELEFVKFHIYTFPDSDFERFRALMGNRFDCIPRRKDTYEFTPTGRSKGTAIDFVLARVGGSIDDCYVFGDSTNDLPMLRHVRHSVAMGNGDREVLEECEYVTDAVGDDGIRNALLHYGLI